MSLFIVTDQTQDEPKEKQLPAPEAFIRFANRTMGLADDPVRAHILFEVIVYSILFVIGAFSNSLVLYKLTLTKRKTSLNILISQLNIADLIVIAITIPIEIIFDLTNLWGSPQNMQANMCQHLQTLRAFGFYLSSMILICISIDRYFAFVHPLSFYRMRERNKKMVCFAWIASILLSIPQSTIVHLKTYPQVEGLQQCVTLGFLKNKNMATLINLKSIIFLYFAPLIVIIYCYVRIILAIHNVPDFIKDAKRASKRKNAVVTVQTNAAKLPTTRIVTSRSFPSYAGLTVDQSSFPSNDLEPKPDLLSTQKLTGKKPANVSQALRVENLVLRKANQNLQKQKLIKEVADGDAEQQAESFGASVESIGSKVNKRITQERTNEKLPDKPNDKKTIGDLDELIDSEIALVFSVPDEQIRKRRNSRPRIILNRRSDSLSISREKAKTNLKRNRSHKLVRDTRSIEIKDCRTKGVREIKIRDPTEKRPESGLASKIATFKPIASLISKTTKNSKRSNESSITLSAKQIKRSSSEQEFSNLKPKRTSRLSQDLGQRATGSLVNTQLYSREIIMSRAKRRTLKVTILIVVSFVTCWSPYILIALWHQVFEESAKTVNTWIQELFFLLAVANSCVNGLVVYSIHM